jgi:hypothetical protein
MNSNQTLRVSLKQSILSAVLGASVLVAAVSSQAGAVAVDSRTAGIGGWGVARADEGTPSRQLSLAIERAVRFGGSAPYIRAYQFNVPRGCYASLAIGVVTGKGWAGNWSYGATVAEAERKARAGMERQCATQIHVVKTWRE